MYGNRNRPDETLFYKNGQQKLRSFWNSSRHEPGIAGLARHDLHIYFDNRRRFVGQFGVLVSQPEIKIVHDVRRVAGRQVRRYAVHGLGMNCRGRERTADVGRGKPVGGVIAVALRIGNEVLRPRRADHRATDRLVLIGVRPRHVAAYAVHVPIGIPGEYDRAVHRGFGIQEGKDAEAIHPAERRTRGRQAFAVGTVNDLCAVMYHIYVLNRPVRIGVLCRLRNERSRTIRHGRRWH